LKVALGLSPSREYALLIQNFSPLTDFVCFLAVELDSSKHGVLEATPVITTGSGDFAKVAQSDGFMELPPNSGTVKKGIVGQVYRW